MAVARRWWPIAAMVLALAGVNVVSNRVVDARWYVPWAVASAVVLLAFARLVDHRTWDELGLDRRNVGRGLRWGAVLIGVVLVVYLVGVAIPATRDLFRDDRVKGWSLGRTLDAALIRVPFGTVLLEEIAFRGVLPAMVAARTTRRVAVAVAAVSFGLWHILPAAGLGHRNPVAQGAIGSAPGWIPVALAVVSTAAVGVWFWWLRHRSRSLIAPMALHWATNALGYVFAYFVWRA